MPKKEPTGITTTRITTRGTIIIAIITLISTLIVGYWQFVLKPNTQSLSTEMQYVGRVIDAGTLLPISGAKVTLDLQGVPPVVYTDSEGVYQFNLLINNTVSGRIKVDAQGYVSYTRNISLSPDLNQIEDIRLLGITPVIISETSSVIIVNTNTEIPTPTLTPTPTLIPASTELPDVPTQLIQHIDNYYTCLNSGNPNDGDDSDYETCWNMLSDRPGEYQSGLNKNNFLAYWKKYKIKYALFYCSKSTQNSVQHFVHTRYYLYDRNDDSAPIGNGTQYYIEYLFAHDEQGWRIKAANVNIDDIGSFCESDPRINILP